MAKAEMLMPLQKQVLTRVFEYAGVRLPDPDIAMSPAEVRDFLAATGRPDLTSAEIQGPEVRGTEQVYTLRRVTGSKGSSKQSATRMTGLEAAMQRLARKSSQATTPVDVQQAVSVLAANKGHTPINLPAEAVPWLG